MTTKTLFELEAYDKERMRSASEILLEARRTLRPIHDLPVELRPSTLEEAYYLQDVMQLAYGDVGGWKIGVASREAVPIYGPMRFSTIGRSGDLMAKSMRRMRGVEAEISFLLGDDLLPRSAPYTRDEVVAAIKSCQPAIETLESAFSNPDEVDRLTMIGDLQMHGGFVHGAPVPGWQDFDFSTEKASMIVDGIARVENGKNAAGGDLIALVEWLANHGQPRTGGLQSGQWITTGSWTGKILLERGSEAVAKFDHFGEASLRFE